MFQRCPNINAAAALIQVAWAFLYADRESVRTRTVCLPAASGLLLCMPIEGPDMEGKMRLVARANTFIALEQAEPDQVPIAASTDPARSVLAAAIEK